MRIGSVSPAINSYSTIATAKSNKQVFKTALNLEANTVIDLGSINNKPMKMKIFRDGGFEWSGGLMIKAHPGNEVTPEDEAASQAYDAYTRNEHIQADRLLSVVNDLYAVTKRGYSVDIFNKSMQGRGITSAEIDEAIKRLGLDPAKPFTVNDMTFKLESGQLKEVNNDYKTSMNLEANNEIDLGNINNKPMKIKIFSEGGFEWSGSLRIKAGATGSTISPEALEAARIFDSYTRSEHEQAERLLSVVHDLYSMNKRGTSVDIFNKGMQGRGITSAEIDEALKRLGFNPAKPFTLNDRTFKVQLGQLKEVKNN